MVLWLLWVMLSWYVIFAVELCYLCFSKLFQMITYSLGLNKTISIQIEIFDSDLWKKVQYGDISYYSLLSFDHIYPRHGMACFGCIVWWMHHLIKNCNKTICWCVLHLITSLPSFSKSAQTEHSVLDKMLLLLSKRSSNWKALLILSNVQISNMHHTKRYCFFLWKR